MSTGIPQAEISARGPLSRADFLALLYWFSDTRAVPEVNGICGLSRLTRLALILGEETGLSREIQPYFTFHPTPNGGVATRRTCASMAVLVSSLSNAVRGPVDDKTALTGLWDYDLSFTGDRRRTADTAAVARDPGRDVA